MRNDGMSVISLSYSTCLARKVSDLGTFDFQDTKAITHGQRANFVRFLQMEYLFLFIHRSIHCKE